MSPPTSGQHDLDRILDRFEEAWRGGTPPRLEEYVPSEVNARREVLPELIKIDLEYRWCKARMPGQTVIPGAAPGERVQLEEYVRRFPELGPTDRLPAGLIAEEYRARSWAGERPKHQEFISRFGQRDTELRGLLEKIDAELKRESSPAVPTLVPGATLSDTGRSLPTVDSLLETLRSLPLLSESQLGTLLQDRSRFADARMLARHLLEQAWLTPYQVNQLVAGRAADLVLGPYILLERLGESFKGQVFKARHQRMNRLVALKMIRKELLANAETVRRFYREVQAAGLLSHPHVVHAFDAGPMGATHVLAMEFVDGIDLACLVKQSGPLPVAQACDYIRQAALGLQAIQDHGLIHRDIKPSNLLVSSGTANDRSPANHQVKVLDLGLALLHRPVDAQLTETLTQEGAVMGTPDFMAPEQAEDPHRVDVRADLYSLGCTLYYLLTGVVPFPAATLLQKLDRHRWQEPPPVQQFRGDVPPAVAAIVAKLMAKRPEARFQKPAEVAVALAEALRHLPSGPLVPVVLQRPALGAPAQARPSLPLSPPNPFARPRSWRRWQVSAAGFIVLGALALGLSILYRPDGPSAPSARNTAPAARSILDDLRAEAIPAEERLPGQPAELVAVLGEHRWRHGSPVNAVAFSPDGQLVASGSSSPDIRLDYTDPKQKGSMLLRGHIGAVRDLAFSPDGKLLASASEDRTVMLWDVAAATKINTLDSHGGTVLAVAFSHDGTTLFSASSDKTLKFWNTANSRGKLKERASFALNAPVTALAVGRQVLACGLGDGTVKLWDLAGEKDRPAFLAHRGATAAIALSPDDRTVASGGWDNLVKLWDAATGKEQGTLEPKRTPGTSNRIHALIYSRDGTTLLLGKDGNDGDVETWEVSTRKPGKPFKGHVAGVTALALSRDGTLLVSGSTDHAVKLWDRSNGNQRLAWQGHSNRVKAIAFSPDGRSLASAGTDRKLKVWNVLAGKVERTLPLAGADPHALTFSPDGKTLAWTVKTGGGETCLLDLAAAGPLRFPGNGYDHITVAFSPDSKTAASVGNHYDRSIRFIDVATGKARTWNNDVKESAFMALAFAPDGAALATAGDDKTVRRWDLATSRSTLLGEHGSRVLFVTFVDGQTLVTASEDRVVKVWDSAIAGEKSFFRVEQVDSLTASSVAYAPANRSLVFAGRNGQLVQRGLAGNTLQQLTLPGPIDSVAIAPDGRHVAVGNTNGTIYILRLAAGSQ